MIILTELTEEEFKKHFFKLPVGYETPSGNKCTTFLCSMDTYEQVVLPINIGESKIESRKFNDPDGDFKMITTILIKSGGNLAIIAQ